MLRIQTPLPDGYAGADPDDLAQRISAAKAALGIACSSSATTTNATR